MNNNDDDLIYETGPLEGAAAVRVFLPGVEGPVRIQADVSRRHRIKAWRATRKRGQRGDWYTTKLLDRASYWSSEHAVEVTPTAPDRDTALIVEVSSKRKVITALRVWKG